MEWEEVCRKNYVALVRSGILEDESCKAVYVIFTGPEEYVNTLKQIFRHEKVLFEYMGPDIKTHEYYGIKKIKDLSRQYPRDKLCYFHSKGVTRRVLSEDWVRYMEYFILDKYDECLTKLNNHDVVGTEYLARPRHHISGNFWWATSKHVSRLLVPSKQDPRHSFEWFILTSKKPIRVWNFHNSENTPGYYGFNKVGRRKYFFYEYKDTNQGMTIEL